MMNLKTGETFLDLDLTNPPDIHMESSYDCAALQKPILFSNSRTLELDDCTISDEMMEKIIGITDVNPNKFTLEFDTTWFVQARKHKKKRINKKWLKRYGYKEVTGRKKMKVKNFKADPDKYIDGLTTMAFELDS